MNVFTDNDSLCNNDIGYSTANSIEDIDREQWQRIHTSPCPFDNFSFHLALEQSGSVSSEQGWQPCHLILHENNNIRTIVNAYKKTHSWGEYVFDWDWANAYQRHNIEYYPKLVATLPFTPVTSPNRNFSNYQSNTFQALTQLCIQQNLSSWHLLYSAPLKEVPSDVFERYSVQFHWFNKGYTSFDDFLTRFTARKRKNTKKERRSIAAQGVGIEVVLGPDIDKAQLAYFYMAYQLTYLKRGHTPHLNLAFFEQLIATQAHNILLVMAKQQGEYVACAWFFYDNNSLYGRYWGCTSNIKNLHFELCYYQGIEFCIANKLSTFNPGTQGEHKIQRGFEAILTHSYHWIKHPQFSQAIKDFCQRERQHMLAYQQQCLAALPFK